MTTKEIVNLLRCSGTDIDRKAANLIESQLREIVELKANQSLWSIRKRPELEKELVEAHACIKTTTENWLNATKKIAELRKDKERLEWILRNPTTFHKDWMWSTFQPASDLESHRKCVDRSMGKHAAAIKTP